MLANPRRNNSFDCIWHSMPALGDASDPGRLVLHPPRTTARLRYAVRPSRGPPPGRPAPPERSSQASGVATAPRPPKRAKKTQTRGARQGQTLVRQRYSPA